MTAPDSVTALVFDFDGLLIDTETIALRAWEMTLGAAEVSVPRAAWRAAIGSAKSQSVIHDILSDWLGTRAAAALCAEWMELHVATVGTSNPRAGVEAYLSDAASLGLRLAVASGATSDWVVGNLRRVGLHHLFDVVICGDELPSKPSPDIYLAALAALKLPAGLAMAFEDSPTGVAAAKAAGLRCVAVPNEATVGLPFWQADMVLGSMEDTGLTTVLDVLGSRMV